MLKVERLQSKIGEVRGICGIFVPSPPTLWTTTLIFNTNLYVAHRKFGVPVYHRFCAAPPTLVCGGQTDGQTDRFAIARTNITLLGNVHQKL